VSDGDRRDSTAQPRFDVATLVVVSLAMAFPTLTTWLYFVVLPRFGDPGRPNPLFVAGYSLGKVAQFALPVAWWYFWTRRVANRSWQERYEPRVGRSLAWGVGFGLLVGVGIVGLYFAVLGEWVRSLGASEPIRVRIAASGLGTPAGFLLIALFYSLLHSFLEEYYWRWFVFGQLRSFLSLWPAVIVSSLAFMAHHVVVLDAFFPSKLIEATLPFSFGVAVGGAFWAWLYERDGTLLGPWISHVLVDAALMAVGFSLVFSPT